MAAAPASQNGFFLCFCGIAAEMALTMAVQVVESPSALRVTPQLTSPKYVPLTLPCKSFRCSAPTDGGNVLLESVTVWFSSAFSICFVLACTSARLSCTTVSAVAAPATLIAPRAVFLAVTFFAAAFLAGAFFFAGMECGVVEAVLTGAVSLRCLRMKPSLRGYMLAGRARLPKEIYYVYM